MSTTTIFLVCLSLAAASFTTGCGGDKVAGSDTAVPPDTTTPDTTTPDAEPDAEPDTSPTLPQACGTTSSAALAGCVEKSRLIADLGTIEGARPTGTAHHATVRAFLAARLATLDFDVELDDYGRGINVIGTRLGKTSPNELVVISAHYDSVPNCPGADDNGTGVMGALEAARILATVEHDRTLVIAFWDEEERGLLGAYDWTDRLARSGGQVVVSFVLEMIGYSSDEENSQTLPNGFDVLFPDVVASVGANGNRGDFIALIADASSAPYTTAMADLGAALGHSTVPLLVPELLIDTNLIGDLRRSDHAAFWAYGWTAMMITDTANFRNPNYHCAAGPDAATDIDFDFAANTIATTIYAAAIALDDDAPTTARPAPTPECDFVAQTGCAIGKRCTISGAGAGLFQAACLNIPANAAGPGEACTRPTEIVGEDTCEPGQFCTFWGKPLGTPQERWCRTLCVADSDCPSNERCQAFLSAAPGNGACLPTCDPFAEDACPAQGNCIGERVGTDRKAAFGCARVGTTAVGGGCSMRSDNCVAGAMCARSPTDGVQRCSVHCDVDHPCEGTQTCVALPNLPTDLVASGRGTCE